MPRNRLPVLTDEEVLWLLYDKGPVGLTGSELALLVTGRRFEPGQLGRLCESGKLSAVIQPPNRPDHETFVYRLSFSTWVELSVQAARAEVSSCSGST